MNGTIHQQVVKLIVEQLGVAVEEVTPDASFRDDLCADSLDYIELVMEAEERFGIEILDSEAHFERVQDAIALITAKVGWKDSRRADMGQAFDRDGNVLGEASGKTKREVFEELDRKFQDAEEIRVRSLGQKVQEEAREDSSAYIQMPRYRCHKEVHALQITGVGPTDDDGSATLFFEEPYSPIVVVRSWLQKHAPHVGAYYVLYKDGYASVSPAAAFEEGYTRIDAAPSSP